ncbi:hypothetical protein [Marivita geojedonensis]|uniref:hypothetical protein n=1 Tax=Marivita geojedonensis TaxID=1123756 RepID=UPI000A1FDEF3|nr:hypothetical protein [Marivita geojedonensis]PRY82064.1 hypothetical protein CLV76_101606 [Marivita geojedonensis]
MGHDWIIDVLTDLKTFAAANDLDALAAKLDDTQLFARAELVSHGEGMSRGLLGESASAGRCDRTIGVRRTS